MDQEISHPSCMITCDKSLNNTAKISAVYDTVEHTNTCVGMSPKEWHYQWDGVSCVTHSECCNVTSVGVQACVQFEWEWRKSNLCIATVMYYIAMIHCNDTLKKLHGFISLSLPKATHEMPLYQLYPIHMDQPTWVRPWLVGTREKGICNALNWNWSCQVHQPPTLALSDVSFIQ